MTKESLDKFHTAFFDVFLSRSDMGIVHAYHAIRSQSQKNALLRLAKTLSEGEVND